MASGRGVRIDPAALIRPCFALAVAVGGLMLARSSDALPQALGIALAALGVIEAARGLWSPARRDGSRAGSGQTWAVVLWMVLLLGGLAFAGPVLAGPLFCLTWLVLRERRKISFSVSVAAALGVALWLGFVKAMGFDMVRGLPLAVMLWG